MVFASMSKELYGMEMYPTNDVFVFVKAVKYCKSLTLIKGALPVHLAEQIRKPCS